MNIELGLEPKLPDRLIYLLQKFCSDYNTMS
jgi:hypothetical protein